MDWEYTDTDRDLAERAVDGFVPERVFDAHAHLYAAEHFQSGAPALVANGAPVVDLTTYRACMAQVLPGRELHGFFFGFPALGMDIDAGNAHVASEVQADPPSRAALMIRPDMVPDQIRATVRRDGFAGLKCYHIYSAEQPTFASRIESYLPEAQVQLAHEENLAIVLHMVRARALADPDNLATIQRYALQYPNARLILAHAARGFNPHHTVEAIGALSGLRNVWCDTSAVTECGAFEAIVRALGVDRLLYGSDFPISHSCGRCVAIGDSFLWLTPENTRFEAAYADLRPTLVGVESVRALRLACLNLGLSRDGIEAVFHRNAEELFGIDTQSEPQPARA